MKFIGKVITLTGMAVLGPKGSYLFLIVVNCVCFSEQLGDAHKVCLFQVLKSREGFVEILGEVEHLLGNLDDLLLLGTCHLDKLLHDGVRDEGVSL